MSVLKKVFLVTIFIISISFSFCYAIDENQLTLDTNQTSTTQMEDNTISEEGTTSQAENTIGITASDNTAESTTSSSESFSSIDSDTQASTTVSSVSTVSKTSTITNILNIALLVVGVLLIFLAIAILIRLNS